MCVFYFILFFASSGDGGRWLVLFRDRLDRESSFKVLFSVYYWTVGYTFSFASSSIRLRYNDVDGRP